VYVGICVCVYLYEYVYSPTISSPHPLPRCDAGHEGKVESVAGFELRAIPYVVCVCEYVYINIVCVRCVWMCKSCVLCVCVYEYIYIYIYICVCVCVCVLCV